MELKIKYKLLIVNIKTAVLFFIMLFFIIFTSCASFETTLGTNIDTEANTYELAMGYNYINKLNLLAFGNIGFLMNNPSHSLVYTFGMEYEHYYYKFAGISGGIGYRHKSSSLYRNGPTNKFDAVLLRFGIPFSWTYGKITPYVGIVFYDKPQINFGISLALRNKAVAVFLYGILLVLDAVGEAANNEDVKD